MFCQVKRLNFLLMTILFILGLDVNTLNQKSNYCIKSLNQWFIVNRLHVNVDKTNIMVANDISVKLNEITLKKVELLEWHRAASNGFYCLFTTDFQDRASC